MESLPKKRARLKSIIAVLDKAYPDAKLALEFSTPLELLVALILAAQSRDERVNEVTAKVFRVYRSPADWADEKREVLEEQLKQINFYRRKSAAIQGACRAIVDRFSGRVPSDLDDLVSLPGVGRKTANVLLGNAFGRQDAIGVDTHVGRVSGRLGLSDHEDPDQIEADLTAVVPRGKGVRFCHLLQFHGRRICVAGKPRCPECPVRELCPYPKKTQPAPRPKSPPARARRRSG